MSETVALEGKEYTSSKRASQLSGYTQDYVGQLARSGQIDAHRVSGLWYVYMDSLLSYKKVADDYKPQPPRRNDSPANVPETIVAIDGKDYVSSSRASQITGYHPDYVGQLARSGSVLSQQVGNRWYVERDALLSHKQEKDALLAAVQAEAAGVMRDAAKDTSTLNEQAFLTYTSENEDLTPVIEDKSSSTDLDAEDTDPVAIPIHVLNNRASAERRLDVSGGTGKGYSRTKSYVYGPAAAALLTVVIVLTFGFTTLKNSSLYAAVASSRASGPVAYTWGIIDEIGNILEGILSPELTYTNSH